MAMKQEKIDPLHSALPWRVFEGSDYADPSAESTHAIADAGDWTIAVLIGDCVPDQSANAAMIVRAVNHHDALTSALKHALQTKHDIRTCACGNCEDARAALATTQE